MAMNYIGEPSRTMNEPDSMIDLDIDVGFFKDNELFQAYVSNQLEKYSSILPSPGEVPRSDIPSSKDASFFSILKKLMDRKEISSNGSISILNESDSIMMFGMRVSSLKSDYMISERTKWVTRPGYPSKSHHLLHASKVIPWTAIGKQAIKKGVSIYDTQTKIAEAAIEYNPDLGAFEGGETYKSPLGRGLSFPVMRMARLCLYNDKLFSDGLVSDEFLPAKPNFESLSSMDDVIIQNPTGSVGFWSLEHMVEPGKSYLSSPLYKKLLNRAKERADWYSTKVRTMRELAAEIAPHAVGQRHQGYGRAIMMMEKPSFFIGSLWGQPLTFYLDGEPWYMSGDRQERLRKTNLLLNGKVKCLVDGDDFVIDVDGVPIAGDYSAYESSFRRADYKAFVRWLTSGIINKTKYNLDNVICNHYLGTTALAIVDGYGIFHRTIGHGINSGDPTTHTAESVINYQSLMSALSYGVKDISSLVSYLSTIGREIRESAQYVPKDGHVLLSKTISNGKQIYGSAIRALWSISASEGPWSIPHDQTASEWLDGRTLSILANVVENPLYNMVLDYLKQTGYHMRTSRTKSMKLAEEKTTQRRGMTKNREGKALKTGVMERKALSMTWKSLVSHGLA